MRLVYFSLFLLLLTGCALNSTTYISANESFVLGENKHSGYSATIENIGPVPIEVIIVFKNGVETSLGVLKSGETDSYNVESNATIRFKNKGTKEGVIKIKAKGEQNLTMGYTENKPVTD